MRKRVFGRMRTARIQMSLRIRAVWSGHSDCPLAEYPDDTWRRRRIIWICAFGACLKDFISLDAAHMDSSIYIKRVLYEDTTLLLHFVCSLRLGQYNLRFPLGITVWPCWRLRRNGYLLIVQSHCDYNGRKQAIGNCGNMHWHKI